MSDSEIHSPEDTIAQSDPGDETSDRYRFQWTWAAIMCCALLDDTQDIVEVFCEHHEDVLIKHQDGSFTGHQVKTRGEDQPLWKARDDAVLSACVRFSKLESEFPSQFRGFLFLSNHPLFSGGNGQDLNFILKSIRNAHSIADLPKNVAPWFKKVVGLANVTEEVAFAALSKTEAKADLPKLRDATMRLTSSIAQCWPPANECSHESVTKAALALIEECGRASSLDHIQLLPAYLIATSNDDTEKEARIEGKRMTLGRVQSLLEAGRDSKAELAGDPSLYVEPGEGSTELLHAKLDAGGFSSVSRNSAEDLRDKADYLAIVWTKKFGHDKGLKRYDHILTLVLSDAGRAFDTTQTKTDRFGPEMREDLYRRFRERRESGFQLYDCTEEHLEGFAFSLTAQCKIIWSHTRPWESK